MVSEHSDNNIEYIKGAPVFRLRNRLLPLVSLNEVLDLGTSEALEQLKGNTEDTPTEKSHCEDDALTPDISQAKTKNEDCKTISNLYIVIAEVGGYEFGIIVDRVFDTEEIVVKPVAKILKNLQIFSGNTILGDGSVIMILDPNGIANKTGTIDANDLQDESQETLISDSNKKTSLLLFNVGDNTPKAVPLSLVARLENVKVKDIEFSSGQMMVQYRGTLMPLIPFNPSVQVGADGEKPVLVFADKVQSMGIIVDEIVDIIEEHINVQVSSSQQGLLGSAIINGHATDVVDIAHFLNGVNRDWFKDHDDTPFDSAENSHSAGKTRKRILLVDDSAFFRNMLTPLLGVAGYDVTALERPADALKLCEDGEVFDAIISDIEMPDMNGFEFAQNVRKEDSKWIKTPMVALSSHATPADIERGTQVGFTNYVAKFDKDTLLNALSQTLNH